MREYKDEAHMRALLQRDCAMAGGVKAWAKENGFCKSYVQRAFVGQCKLGDGIARALGYEKKSVFTACNQENASA